MIYEPKQEVYGVLSGAGTGAQVHQSRPEVIEEFPSVTFSVNSNVPSYDLSKGVGPQDIEVTVDIWARTSGESSSILEAVESAMREADYRLIFSRDVADPEGISHVNTIFNLVG